MPNKTIYVSDKDEPLFEQAQKLGNDALSAVIVRAIKEFVSRNEDRKKGMKEVTIHVGTAGIEREQRFIGQKVAKWQGTSDDKVWWMEAVIYQTQKGNWAVWLTTVAKAELLINGARNWLDWADSPRRSELLVGAAPSELLSKIPTALHSILEDAAAKNGNDAEYLDI